MRLFKRHLLARGLKQKDLAKSMHVSDATVSMWVNGKKTPTPEHVVELARELEIHPFDLTKILVPDPVTSQFAPA